VRSDLARLAGGSDEVEVDTVGEDVCEVNRPDASRERFEYRGGGVEAGLMATVI